MTMTLIATSTVGSGGAASIDFTSIPQTGTDLLVIHSLRSGGTWSIPSVRMNGDTTYSNYTTRTLWGSGTAAGSETNTGDNGGFGLMSISSDTASTFGSTSVYIPNYSGTTAKSWSVDGVRENNSSVNGASGQYLVAVRWSGTAAISSLVVWNPGAGGFAQYSTVSLYTITKGSGGATVA